MAAQRGRLWVKIPRGNQANQGEMGALRRQLKELKLEMRNLWCDWRVEGWDDGANGDHNFHSDPSEGEIDEFVREEELHVPRHGPMPPEHGGFVKRLVHAFESNNVGVRIDVADFMGCIHPEDYLDWETQSSFVKMKLKESAWRNK